MLVGGKEKKENTEEDGYQEHTDGRPFCDNMDHECHEDTQKLALLGRWGVNGLITLDEAGLIFQGKTL